jgi:zinc protease
LTLWIEAQRLAFGLLGVDEEGFEREQAIVDHEERLRDSAWTIADRHLWRMLLDDGSRYYPSSGPGDVTGRNRDDVLTFVQASYAPDSAVLVVAGDLDPAATLAMVQRHFGALRRSAPRLAGRTRMIPREQPGLDSIIVPFTHDLVLLGWTAPALFARGDAELDLAAEVLERRLQRELVDLASEAASVSVRHLSLAQGSIFLVRSAANRGSDPGMLRARLGEEVQRLAKVLVSDDELESARARELDRARPDEDVLDRALALAAYHRILGDIDGFEANRLRYQAVTAGALRDAVRRHLAPGRAAGLIGEGRR